MPNPLALLDRLLARFDDWIARVVDPWVWHPQWPGGRSEFAWRVLQFRNELAKVQMAIVDLLTPTLREVATVVRELATALHEYAPGT